MFGSVARTVGAGATIQTLKPHGQGEPALLIRCCKVVGRLEILRQHPRSFDCRNAEDCQKYDQTDQNRSLDVSWIHHPRHIVYGGMRNTLCVCMYVCMRERERESLLLYELWRSQGFCICFYSVGEVDCGVFLGYFIHCTVATNVWMNGVYLLTKILTYVSDGNTNQQHML